MVLRNKIGALNFCRGGAGNLFWFSPAVLRDFLQTLLRLMQRQYLWQQTLFSHPNSNRLTYSVNEIGHCSWSVVKYSTRWTI